MINILNTTKLLTLNFISILSSFIKIYLVFLITPYSLKFVGLFCNRKDKRNLNRLSNSLIKFNKKGLKNIKKSIFKFNKKISYLYKSILLSMKFKSFILLFKMDDLKNSIMHLDPEEFEQFCASIYRKLGYKAKVTKFTHDGGKDVILTDKDNNLIYIECKRWHELYGKEIGREICQKLIGSCASDGVKNAILVTTGKIHKNAIEYQKNLNKTKSFNLQIVDFEELIFLYIKAYGTNNINKFEREAI